MHEFEFDQLSKADLLVEAIYKGGRKGNYGDDPLPKLLGVNNQGGFRYLGSIEDLKLMVLTSSLNDPDWPDHLDMESGIFTYYGDNKKPGKDLHGTPRFGNLILQNIFNAIHEDFSNRKNIPPIFVFGSTGNYRDVKFLGLAVPGAIEIQSHEDLVAIWKISKGKRFQNYVAKFTIVDSALISQKWISDIKAGNQMSKNCPKVWRQWVERGKYTPLKAKRSIEFRNKNEQIPQDEPQKQMVKTIQTYFSENHFLFEPCAAKIAQIGLKNIVEIDLTRPYKDGGRDAIGKYRIGGEEFGIPVEFALEAKCYSLKTSVGVKETSRLISRLRHRQFGVLVTTSYLGQQAYKEIREDQHPIIIISAIDIVRILGQIGVSSIANLNDWLKAEFPKEE